MNTNESQPASLAVEAPARRPGMGRPFLILLIVGAVLLLARLLPVAEWLRMFNEWVAEVGPLGVVVFVAAYILAAVLFLPGSVLTLGAGFVFGVVKGMAVVSLASTLGAAAAFLTSILATPGGRGWKPLRVETTSAGCDWPTSARVCSPRSLSRFT